MLRPEVRLQLVRVPMQIRSFHFRPRVRIPVLGMRVVVLGPSVVVDPVVVGSLTVAMVLVVVGIVVLALLVNVVVQGWMPALGWKPVQGTAVCVFPMALAAVGGYPQDFGLRRNGHVYFGAGPETPTFGWKPAAILFVLVFA